MKNPSKLSRVVTLLLAIVLLVSSLALVRFLVNRRPLPQRKVATKLAMQAVKVKTVTRGSYPVVVELYGTVRAEKSYALFSPYSGKVVARKTFVPGEFVAASEVLFDMETSTLDFSIGEKEAELAQLKIEEKQLKADSGFFMNRRDTLGEVLAFNHASIEKQKKRLGSQEGLFASSSELLKRDTVSKTSYLKDEISYFDVQLALINSQTSLSNNSERHHFLNQQLSQNDYDIQKIPYRVRELEYQIADLLNDRGKAAIHVETATRVVEVNIDREQEVSSGTHLATIRNTEAVLIPVTLPDNHFRWLYQGDLLEGGNGELKISLVNHNFEKSFSGGHIRSIGADLDPMTRSLPITIRRENPHDETGSPIAREELRPGAYCKVSLNLCQLKQTFYLPHSAIQEGFRLFLVEGRKLRILKDIEILHENSHGVIVKLPEEIEEINVVTHPIRQAENGLVVSPEVIE